MLYKCLAPELLNELKYGTFHVATCLLCSLAFLPEIGANVTLGNEPIKDELIKSVQGHSAPLQYIGSLARGVKAADLTGGLEISSRVQRGGSNDVWVPDGPMSLCRASSRCCLIGTLRKLALAAGALGSLVCVYDLGGQCFIFCRRCM